MHALTPLPPSQGQPIHPSNPVARWGLRPDFVQSDGSASEDAATRAAHIAAVAAAAFEAKEDSEETDYKRKVVKKDDARDHGVVCVIL
jgi:hypothetical protein